MHIGWLAKQTGLTPDAIRFYERNALLGRAPRTSGGFRQYDEADVNALQFIRQTHELGFTLKEVREFLQLSRHSRPSCTAVRQGLERKNQQVRQKLLGLQMLERELQRALRKCKTELRKPHPCCPILRKGLCQANFNNGR